MYDRIEAPATSAQKAILSSMTPEMLRIAQLGGEPIEFVIATAPGNGAGIGGIRVSTKNGWFAARPSGTEAIYKIYAESFNGQEQLTEILKEAQEIVDKALAAPQP